MVEAKKKRKEKEGGGGGEHWFVKAEGLERERGARRMLIPCDHTSVAERCEGEGLAHVYPDLAPPR